MTGIPKDIKDTSKAQIIALLEGALDKALKGELEFVCLAYQTGQDIKGSWQGIDTAQKTVDATKSLDALRQAILNAKTKVP